MVWVGGIMSKLKITDLKKYLKAKDNKELEEEIVEIVKLFPNVKEYYEAKIYSSNEDDIMEKYRKVIKNEFFPERGFGKLRYSIAQKAITDYKKIATKPRNVAELMISYVEYGVEFTNEFGDIDEKFYGNMERMYQKAIEFIFDNDLENFFQKRCEKIMENSRIIGYGFEYNMDEIFSMYFDVEEEL